MIARVCRETIAQMDVNVTLVTVDPKKNKKHQHKWLYVSSYAYIICVHRYINCNKLDLLRSTIALDQRLRYADSEFVLVKAQATNR